MGSTEVPRAVSPPSSLAESHSGRSAALKDGDGGAEEEAVVWKGAIRRAGIGDRSKKGPGTRPTASYRRREKRGCNDVREGGEKEIDERVCVIHRTIGGHGG